MKTITELKGNWAQTKGKLKQKIAIFTDNELLFVKGKEQELEGRLQAKMGKTKAQIRKMITEL